MLDKAKILERINSTLYFTPCNPFEDGKDYALTELKEEIDSGTFDAPLTEESQEQHSSLADSRMMTITKFAWDEKVEQVRQLREERDNAVKRMNNTVESWNEQRSEIQRLREALGAANSRDYGEYYAWMPDEENHLETLYCNVMIPAEWIRNLIEDGKQAVVEERDKLVKALEELKGGTHE